ncbi:3-hydroxyisobutyrate dehydrogenase [Marinobacter daqiaonensis]|uniref:3-hydroxyisobutyrate dehydrogenase n=1 Tax=Marinobacter daqiaonensis TaxID=650891 RepID=A0A1I6INL0_9GAMM|nr:3-hydroxyisobutyrate dehydrogenase [Marinobacter daqiaonensis]SFR67840.1 3-hydroxyisobutyrate dehydrogenase [Marinobacter daqiaonensis]
MKIGFIGLGNMGAPMASNLLKAGHELTVFDLDQAAVDKAVTEGATAADGLGDISTGDVELIITMLPAAQHVRSVYLGEDGLLASVARGVHLIDSSTIDPMTAREVAARAADQGNPMLDAPVSGGTGGAQAGTLTFMVGGEDEEFAFARPVLANMGKNIVHCGAAGNGQVAKMANNMLLGISMIGAAEAMSLGVAMGMDPEVLAGVINTSSGRCWSTDTYNPYPGVIETAPSNRGYTGGFGMDLMIKDLGLATEAAKTARQPVIMGALAQQLYQGMSFEGHGGLDFSAIIKRYLKEPE